MVFFVQGDWKGVLESKLLKKAAEIDRFFGGSRELYVFAFR